jgi:glycosyltransferase involved in cell wall biosynthesis
MVEEARRACGDRVAWTGRLEAAEVSHRLSTCALCVLPYEEGASLRRTTLLTALAHGAPVVTTRPRRPIDGLEEAALLIDRAEGGLLAAAIRRALGDEALRARLSAGALRLAGRFSWGAVAERTLEVYRSCLNP